MKLVYILSAVAMLGTAACDGPYQLRAAEKKTAEVGALRHFQAAGVDFVSCSGQDSDGDGYVTCTGKARSSTATQTSANPELVCAYRSEGCKRK